MNNKSFELPPEFQPILDPRLIMPDIAKAFVTMQVVRGDVSEAQEAFYEPPHPETYDLGSAQHVVEEVVRLTVFDTIHGLAGVTNMESTNVLLTRLEERLFPMGNRTVHDVQDMLIEIRGRQEELDEAYRASIDTHTEVGDSKLRDDWWLLQYASLVVQDSIVPENQGVRQALFSGRYMPYQLDAIYVSFARLLRHQ